MSASKFFDQNEAGTSSIKNFFSKGKAYPATQETSQNTARVRLKPVPKPGSIQGFFSQMEKNQQITSKDMKRDVFLQSEEVRLITKEKINQNKTSISSSEWNSIPSSNMQVKKSGKGFFATKMETFLKKDEESNDSYAVDVSTDNMAECIDNEYGDVSRIDIEENIEAEDLFGDSTDISEDEEDIKEDQIYKNETMDLDNAVIVSKSSEKSEDSVNVSLQSGMAASTSVVTPGESTTSMPSGGENFDAGDYIKCEKCEQNILVWEMPEHTDFHFAMDLQNETNEQERTGARVMIANHGKRILSGGRGCGSGQSRKKAKLTSAQGTPKLEHFFKK